MSNAVQKLEDAPRSVALTPMDMLHQALASGAGVETMEKLLNLQERWEKTQARRAFDAAMSALRQNMPEIVKNREVDFTSSKGRTNYRHEDLPAVTRALSPVMASHGLSFRWKTENQPNGMVAVTCIISHRDGHFEETTLSASHDNSGNKNSIQAIGSTVTYLQRYTLKAAIGVAAAQDDDGGNADGAPETISEDQVMTIREMLEATDCPLTKYLQFVRLDRLEDMPAASFDSAMKRLREREARR